MSFQWIVNKSETLSINRKAVVAQTTTRSGVVRSVSRGTPPKRFEIKLPDGLTYSQIRSDISAAETLNRHTTASITIAYAKFPWYYGNTAPASDETYTVICTQFPDWTIFQRDLVSWSGPFVFVEVT